MFDKNRFISEWNFAHGTNYRSGTERIQGMLSKVGGNVTDDEMKAFAVASEEDNIYKALAGNKVSDFIHKHREEQAVAEPTPRGTGFGVEFGMLEKALANVMLNEYSDILATEMYERIDNYVKETYGEVTRTINYEIPSRNGALKNQITHEKFEEVLSFVMADEPVMLVGSAGTGKNVICKQVAEAMNLDFYFSNAVTQEHKLTGFIDANGTFHETQFYKAFTNGGLFFLDEIDGSIPEVLIILNAAIANRYFDFPTGKVEAHEDFRVIASGNTYGTGASYEYSGRMQLDGASLDRFAIVEIDYSPRIEENLTEDTELLDFVRSFRSACKNNGINHIVSYRSITRMDKLADLLKLEEILRSCLVKNLEQDDLNIIRNAMGGLGDNRWASALMKVG